jgi:hypothetical protein
MGKERISDWRFQISDGGNWEGVINHDWTRIEKGLFYRRKRRKRRGKILHELTRIDANFRVKGMEDGKWEMGKNDEDGDRQDALSYACCHLARFAERFARQ